MGYYPILMELDDRRALVVGGGGVAERKVRTLLGCGARVQVVSRELSPGLKALADGGRLQWLGREFEESRLDGAVLVIAATSDADLNRRVGGACRERGIPVNVVDQPADCTFIVPAVVRRGDLLLAVSTSGKSPALARAVRRELEERFGPEYGGFLAIMGDVREAVLSQGRVQKDNRDVFRELVQSGLLEAIRAGDWPGAAGILTGILGTEWRAPDVRARVEARERRTNPWP